eukprot:175364-Pyramimonas_sp.AAC.1
MAVELKVRNGWEALAAERLPQQLDDAIKERHYQFFDAAQEMSREELFKLILAPFPMRHKAKGCALIARCLVHAWDRAGRKAFTLQGPC